VVQDGDFGELTGTFDVKDFDKVARVMQPRRRAQRTLSPDQRAELSARMAKMNRERRSEKQLGVQGLVIGTSGV
jgi:hypothetical protein